MCENEKSKEFSSRSKTKELLGKAKVTKNYCRALGILLSLPVILWCLSLQKLLPEKMLLEAGRPYFDREKMDEYWYAVNRKLTDVSLPVEIQTKSPVIFVITPTYYRLTQMADLTRLSNTLSLVPNIHWIVIEDFSTTNEHVQKLLETSGLSFTYLSQQRTNTTPKSLKGAEQRNKGLDWIMEHHNYNSSNSNAVVYFADDDNAYNIKIFEEMRMTKKLSMWPVGFSGGRSAETPILKDGKVVGFDAWNSEKRKFAVDMAGFAINGKVLWDFHPMRFDLKAKIGQQETTFLELCCSLADIEPMANNCTKVLVWHTKTKKPDVWKFGDIPV